MQKLCFANEELRNKFFAHVSPLEGRLFVQTMAGLEPGVYKERYPRKGWCQFTWCVCCLGISCQPESRARYWESYRTALWRTKRIALVCLGINGAVLVQTPEAHKN